MASREGVSSSVSRYFTIIIIQSLLIKTNSELRIINKGADKERILKKLIFAAIFSDQTLSFPTITEWPMSRMSLSCRPSLATGIAGQRGPQILRCYVYLSISSISCHHHRSSTLWFHCAVFCRSSIAKYITKPLFHSSHKHSPARPTRVTPFLGWVAADAGCRFQGINLPNSHADCFLMILIGSVAHL